MTIENITFAVAVNDHDVLRKNLYRSPGLLDDANLEILTKEGFASAALAYNSAIDEARNDIIVFVHQDIYLPETWLPSLKEALKHLEKSQAKWGVLGCFGSRKAAPGGRGQVYTNGMGLHGNRLTLPERIETLDEILLVIRKSSGLRFDADMPHFHLYGTDICMSARDRGLVAYAFQGLCVHNTNQLLHLPREFYECYGYVRRKWKKYLPIYASCMKISQFNEELYRKRLREFGERVIGLQKQPARRVNDPTTFLKGLSSRA